MLMRSLATVISKVVKKSASLFLSEYIDMFTHVYDECREDNEHLSYYFLNSKTNFGLEIRFFVDDLDLDGRTFTMTNKLFSVPTVTVKKLVRQARAIPPDLLENCDCVPCRLKRGENVSIDDRLSYERIVAMQESREYN